MMFRRLIPAVAPLRSAAIRRAAPALGGGSPTTVWGAVQMPPQCRWMSGTPPTNPIRVPEPTDAVPAGEYFKVIVGNLELSTTSEELLSHVKHTGPSNCDIKVKESGGSYGYGILEFDTVEEAHAAVRALNNTTLGNRDLYVREYFPGEVSADRRRERRESSASNLLMSSGNQIFVLNVPREITDEEFASHFATSTGKVLKTAVHRRTNGRSLGHGIVRFGSPSEASEAVKQFDQTELKGQVLQTKIDQYA